VVSIANELNIPVRYIGVGEQVDDLQPFVAHDFAKAMFYDDVSKAEREGGNDDANY